jgi:hypothetical protein
MPSNRWIWGTLFTLAAICVATVWMTPLLPGQDMPQHLANVRIMRDCADPGLPFSEHYEVRGRFQLYFTSYVLVDLLAFARSVEVGARVLMSVYCVAFLASFAGLARASAGGTSGMPVTVALGGLFVWNPTVLMGFLGYSIGLPFLLASVAGTVSWAEGRECWGRWVAIPAAAICAVVHPFLGAMLLLCLVAYAILALNRRRLKVALLPSAVTLAVLGLGMGLGDAGIGDPRSIDWETAIRETYGLDFATLAMGLEWVGAPVKTNFLLWSAFGPFRMPVVFVVACCVAVTAMVVRLAGEERSVMGPGRTSSGTAVRRMAWFVLAAGLAAPFGLNRPTELTFIDLRLLSLSVVLLAASMNPGPWSSSLGRRALAAGCVVLTLHAGYRVVAWGRQSNGFFALLDKTERGRVLAALVYSGHTPHFSQQFRLDYFLPMYYTTRYDGISTQFWGGATHHLPVTYKPGRSFKQAPNFWPQRFTPAHLEGADYLIVRLPSPEQDSRRLQAIAQHISGQLEPYLEEVDVVGPWTLYEVRPSREPTS